jgi:hypothetical protein
MKRNQFRRLTNTLCVGGVLLGGATASVAADDAMDKLIKENQEMKSRLDALELLAQKEGLLPSGSKPPKFVSAMSDITISGFVQSSYFYNTDDPDDGYSDGYLWNTKDNSFSINKVKLTIASAPVERSGEEWDSGFRTSLLWGEDAPVLNTGGESQGLEALREAYVELNVPVGTGLNVKAGQLISMLNWESGDGGAANPNFSQGYQWFYTGNGPAAGVQLGYTLTDWLDVKFRVHNGLYAGAVDANEGKGVMGSIGIKPNEKLWLSLVGFGGDGNASMDVDGGSILGGYQVNEKLGTGFEFDYFSFDPETGSGGDLWSIGGWIWYDFTPKVGLAFRAEYLDDQDGFGIKGVGPRANARIGELAPADPTTTPPTPATLTPDSDGDLSSLTLTLNWRPAPNIKIQPEVRYNHTSYSDGMDGKKSQFIIGAGASYLF